MKDQKFKKVWGIPLLLGVLTLFGLLAALLGTGVWYILSWVAMVTPIVVLLWKIRHHYVVSKSKAVVK